MAKNKAKAGKKTDKLDSATSDTQNGGRSGLAEEPANVKEPSINRVTPNQLRALDKDGEGDTLTAESNEDEEFKDIAELKKVLSELRLENEKLKTVRNGEYCTSKDSEGTTTEHAKTDVNYEAQLQLRALEEQKSQLLADLGQSRTELSSVQHRLEESERARGGVEKQYKLLLEKVGNIRTTLSERFKSDAEELENCKLQITELKGENKSLALAVEALKSEVEALTGETTLLKDREKQAREELQNSYQIWSSEREKIFTEKKDALELIDRYQQSISDLETALADEKSQNSSLSAKIFDFEEQIKSQTDYAERYRKERDTYKDRLQQSLVDSEKSSSLLNHTINDLKDAAEVYKHKLSANDQIIKANEEEIKILKEDSLRLVKAEQDVKEKSLLVGKLRHEAVILNEHLTKALKMIKKGSEGESIDKKLISNMIISFVMIPRGDAKKFEVLQLISNLLEWDDDQKAQAGLTRIQSGSNIKSPQLLPSTQVSRVGSSANLESSSGGFMGLFAEFLERESAKSS